MLKRRIAAITVVALGGLGLTHAVLAATEITASNHTEDSKSKTGDAGATNNAATVVNQGGFQDGDNEADIEQDGNAGSGDAVNGQVIGAVSGGGSGTGTDGGSVDINASSSCEDCKSDTGDANATNNSATVVNQGGFQDGDNEADVEQDADADSGDSNNGQVIGVVSD